MGRATRQINVDDVLSLAGLALLGHVAPILAGGLRLETEQVAQRQAKAETTQGAHGKEVTTVRIGGVIGAATELISALFFHKLYSFQVGRYLASDLDLRFCECIHKNATRIPLFFEGVFGVFSLISKLPLVRRRPADYTA